MKRFRFKFEALETVRKTRENECMRLLSQAQKAFREAVEKKESLQSALQIGLERREQLGIEPIGVVAFLVESDFIVGTKQRIVMADQGILRCRRGVEKALRTFLAARKQTRMIEVLREKAYAEFKQERNKQAQRELDDLYVMRARMTRESA